MKSMSECTQKLGELFHLILKIPGDKILTLATEGDVFTVDIDKNGKVGYFPGHKELFFSKLSRAFSEGGGVIIREFLTLKQKQKMPNGKEMWVPEKNLYGLFLGSFTWRGFSAEEVRQSHGIDGQTGKPIPPEEGIHYKDFPPVL